MILVAWAGLLAVVIRALLRDLRLRASVVFSTWKFLGLRSVSFGSLCHLVPA